MRRPHKPHLVYCLIDPRSDERRYIGKSCSGLARARAHGAPEQLVADTPKAAWLRELASLGLKYRIEVLQECDNLEETLAAERYWISRALAEGWPLTNAVAGGGGDKPGKDAPRLELASMSSMPEGARPPVARTPRIEGLPSLEEVLAEQARRSLREFLEQAWPVVEPSRPFVANWHVDAICEHLQAVSEGKIRRLLITIPPGHMKSLTVSVFWPVWHWLRAPSWRALFASYAEALVVRDSMKRRDILESEWFQSSFRPSWQLAQDQNARDHFKNTASGFMQTTTVGGKGTGLRGDCVACDDPINVKDEHSLAKRKEAIHWWDQVMSSRLNDQRTGVRILMMQRVHMEDLAGHVLERGGYEHLCLPTEFEPDRRCFTSIGWADPRVELGEPLFPQMFPPEVIAEAKRDLGSSGFASQHQQRPAPAEGGMVKRGWWRYWREKTSLRREGSTAVLKPERFDEMIQSWDCTFKDAKTSDFVVGQVWGRVRADKYLLYQTRARLSFSDTLKEIRRVTVLYPRARRKLIEDKANGTAIIDTLKSEISGILPVNPLGGKEARCAAISPQVEAGNIYLPEDAAWVEDYVEEFAAFPNGRHDDQVDGTTQAIIELSDSEGTARLKRLLSSL